MNKLLSIVTVLAALCLITSSMTQAQAVAPSPACLAKMPKGLTFAEQTVYKRKCNTEARAYGVIPPGFVSKPKFTSTDLVWTCIQMKYYPIKESKEITKKVKALNPKILQYCKIMYVDKIWIKKATTPDDYKVILKYYNLTPMGQVLGKKTK